MSVRGPRGHRPRATFDSTCPRCEGTTPITRDNVHVQLDGAVYAKVEDAYRASYGIDSPTSAITTLAQSAMRKEVCSG